MDSKVKDNFISSDTCLHGQASGSDLRPNHLEHDQLALSRIGEFAVTADLPLSDAALRMVRNSVIDVFGCILGGARTQVATAARTSMRCLGADRGRVKIYGTAYRAPANTAALLNGIAGHALEFDDWELPGNTHPSVVLLSALLAVMDKDTTGQDLLTAYVVGYEVIVRLGEALNFEHYDAGWHSTATLGSLGAAAAVARLKQLSSLKAAHAVSIATSRASGLTSQFGADTKALQAGFAAENGVVAAALAAAGVTGKLDVLEHPRGMAAIMGNAPPERLRIAVKKLGVELALEQHGILIKPWPTCGYTHRIMGCALELAKSGINHNEVQDIELFLPDFHAAVLPYDSPDNRWEAMFSLPFMAAMGLVHGNLTLNDLDQKRWREEPVKRLIQRTSVLPFKPSRPTLNYDPLQPDRMRVTLKSGVKFETDCALPLGTPDAPLLDRAVLDKFQQFCKVDQQSEYEELLNWPDSLEVQLIFDKYGDRVVKK